MTRVFQITSGATLKMVRMEDSRLQGLHAATSLSGKSTAAAAANQLSNTRRGRRLH